MENNTREKLKIEYIPITDLRPYEKNAKIHTREQIDQIKASIQEFGMNDPIAIWKDNIIIEGHGRLLACQELGIDEVPIIRLDDLTDEIAKRKGYGSWQLDRASTDIVKQASKNAGYGNSTRKFISKISGYGSTSHAEALAEAFADVYCNGSKAGKESKAIVDIMNSYFNK